MNPSDAIEAIEKPLSSLPYSLSRHILEHLRKLTSHEPVIGIMGKSGAGKSSLCNALFQGEVTPVSDVHAGNRAEMSPEAAGIAACLMTYSHHACRTECYAMTVHYYRLRDYALQHPECNAIMRIID
ncbi:TPA: antirestriction protein [Escherichia coli]